MTESAKIDLAAAVKGVAALAQTNEEKKRQA
jgi:hypothetical protein